MVRIRESQRKMTFTSSRRRSRGTVFKKSFGGIDSMRERYNIRDHRSNGSTRRSRPSPTESSDESLELEMEEEGDRRTRITKSQSKVFDEIIGVPVPRRARTALKRGVQDSVTAPWPSNASKEASEGMVSISESEVEVAKFLYGLTRLHSQHSAATADTFQSSALPDISALSKELKRKKSRHLQSDDTGKPSMMIACNSKLHGASDKVKSTSSVPILSMNGYHADKNSCVKEMEVSSPNLDKNASPSNTGHLKIEAPLLVPKNPIPISVQAEEKPCPTSPMNSELLVSSDLNEQPNSTFLKKGDGNSDASCKASHKQTDQMTENEPNQLKQDLPSLSSQDDKIDPPKNASPVSSVKDVKFEIDLMALPDNTSPDDGEVDATDEGNPHVSDFKQGSINDSNICKSEVIVRLANKMEIGDPKTEQDSGVLNLDKKPHMEGIAEAGMEKQPLIEGRTGSYLDENNLDKLGMKQHSKKILKDAARPLEIAGPPNEITSPISTPIPVSIPCWPCGPRPFGFPCFGLTSISVAPSLQGAIPVEGNTFVPHAPFIMLPPTRPRHCATHCFIARLIHFQQLVRLNPFWHAAGSSAKPYNSSTLPQSSFLLLGGPGIRNPNVLTSGSFGSGSTVTLNCQHPKVNVLDSLRDAKRKTPLLPQQSHQGGVFPINQSQTAGLKASPLSENDLFPASSASSTASASTSTGCSNLAAVPDPYYLTMFKRNYPFPNIPAYQPYITQRQQPQPPLLCGSSNPSQFHSQPLQLPQNPTASTRSSSQKHLQVKRFLHSPKSLSEAHLNEPEHSRNCEDPHSRKKLQNHSLPKGKHCQPWSPLSNQAKTLAKAHSSSSGGPSESNHLKKQVVAQTNSPISTLSASTSTAGSATYSDRNNPQWRMSPSRNMPKPESSLENTSSRKVTPMPSAPTAAKTQQPLCPNSVPGHQNTSVQLMFTGSLNMRRPTISQQAQLGSSVGLTAMAVVSYAQGAASLPAEQKPAAA